MSFRRRLALSTAAAVAVVAVLGSVLAYLIVRATLRDQIDDALRNQVEMIELRRRVQARSPGDRLLLTNTPVFTAFVGAARDGCRSRGRSTATRRSSAVARGEREPFFADRTIEGAHVRVHVARVGGDLGVLRRRGR